MKYSILMLKNSCASKLFMPYRWTMDNGGVNLDEYEAVYTGQIERFWAVDAALEDIFEDIFVMFNLNRPADYRGRSMSVSDLVVLEGIGTYYCDSVGFQKID